MLVLIASSTADGLFRTTVGSDGALTADLDAIGGCIRFCETMAFSRGGNGMFSWDDHGGIETDVLESDGHYRPRFIYQIRLPNQPGTAILYGIPR